MRNPKRNNVTTEQDWGGGRGYLREAKRYKRGLPSSVHINLWRDGKLDYSEIFQLLSVDCRTLFNCLYDKA